MFSASGAMLRLLCRLRLIDALSPIPPPPPTPTLLLPTRAQPPPNFDPFHELIYWDELARQGSGGLLASLFFSIKIGLPPVLNGIANKALRERVGREVITGQSGIALAVSGNEARGSERGERGYLRIGATARPSCLNSSCAQSRSLDRMWRGLALRLCAKAISIV